MEFRIFTKFIFIFKNTICNSFNGCNHWFWIFITIILRIYIIKTTCYINIGFKSNSTSLIVINSDCSTICKVNWKFINWNYINVISNSNLASCFINFFCISIIISITCTTKSIFFSFAYISFIWIVNCNYFFRNVFNCKCSSSRFTYNSNIVNTFSYVNICSYCWTCRIWWIIPSNVNLYTVFYWRNFKCFCYINRRSPFVRLCCISMFLRPFFFGIGNGLSNLRLCFVMCSFVFSFFFKI